MTDPQAHETDTTESTDVLPALAEDALVEEVSIDGMCGVY